MKAIVYTRYGPPEVLTLKDMAKPVPKKNEILIKLLATTVTSGDVRLRKSDPIFARLITGLFRPKNPILGFDVSGVVEAVGKAVQRFKKGDQVFGTTGSDSGSYAQYTCLAQDSVLTIKPDHIGHDQAAALFFGGHTALHFLKKADIGPQKKILVYGASGCVGTYAVQLARYFGAHVTGVTSTQNLELVTSLGANQVVDYTQTDFSTHSDCYDIIFDTVGKSNFSWCINSLGKKGIYLRAVHIAVSAILKGLWTHMTTGKKVIGGVARECQQDLDFLKTLAENRQIKPVIDRQYPLEKIPEAHTYVEKGHKKGNVVISIAHSDQKTGNG